MSLESFWNDLHYEDIHFRDSLQFELQSDFAPVADAEETISTQELYFFIPAALQINQETYSKEQFYKDRTNLIRFKTPEFSFEELVDPDNTQSPLQRLQALKNSQDSSGTVVIIQDELKLLGNVVRSALRVGVRNFLQELAKKPSPALDEKMQREISIFCLSVITFRDLFWSILQECLGKWSGSPLQCFLYVDEFISLSIDSYMTGFLQTLRHDNVEHLHSIDHQLCDLIALEKKHRQEYFQECIQETIPKETPQQLEMEVYHKSLLNKYVLDALLLLLEQTSWVEKYGNIVAALAAGIAMLIYVLLVFLNGPYFGINSLPFLLLTVILYVLKDRVKDSLRGIFHHHAVRLFSDFSTQIHMASGEETLGEVKEFFSFFGSDDDIPEDIMHLRQTRFESDLPLFKQPETAFYYKKEILLNEKLSSKKARRHKLHNLFLFNVHLLLEKASDPIEPTLNLDLNTMEIKELKLPKVYHLNIIMKNTQPLPDGSQRVELRNFRIVLDKNGIKRVELV